MKGEKCLVADFKKIKFAILNIRNDRDASAKAWKMVIKSTLLKNN